MPTSDEILELTRTIANDWMAGAIAWHVLLFVALLAVAVGWRPTHRTAALMITALTASVAVTAIVSGNPFNGAVFTVLTIALVALAWRDRRGAIRHVPTAWQVAGALMLAFGWVYPHFLDGSPLAYVYAAPVGLIPCPTLSVAIGLALLAGGAGRRSWRGTLAGAGVFYGVYGVVVLGVMLDVALLAGALVLASTVMTREVRTRAHRSAVTVA